MGVKRRANGWGARRDAALFVRGGSQAGRAASRNPMGLRSSASRIHPATWARSWRTVNPASRANLTRVSVQAAAAGHRGPRRRRPGLQRPARLPGEVHVFEEQQRPAGNEDPAELGERRRRLGHRAQREGAHGGVEGGVGERQLFGAALDERDARHALRRPPPRSCEHRGVGLERGDVGAGTVPAELASRPGADLDHAADRGPRQAPPPGADGGAFERPHGRVVHGRVASRRG